MNNFLAIDTSSKHLSIVAKKGEKVVQKFLPDCALNHSVMLMGEIDKALKECDLAPCECDFFCAVTGPGSFTGIRIGISTVKGLALGAKKELAQITSFDQVAYNIKMDDFCVVIDAGRDFYYAQAYSNGKITLPACYLSKEQVQSLGKTLVGFEALALDNYQKISLEGCLYNAIMRKGDVKTGELSALYIRKSQAEENRK